jgi:hypothetical protein
MGNLFLVETVKEISLGRLNATAADNSMIWTVYRTVNISALYGLI